MSDESKGISDVSRRKLSLTAEKAAEQRREDNQEKVARRKVAQPTSPAQHAIAGAVQQSVNLEKVAIAGGFDPSASNWMNNVPADALANDLPRWAQKYQGPPGDHGWQHYGRPFGIPADQWVGGFGFKKQMKDSLAADQQRGWVVLNASTPGIDVPAYAIDGATGAVVSYGKDRQHPELVLLYTSWARYRDEYGDPFEVDTSMRTAIGAAGMAAQESTKKIKQPNLAKVMASEDEEGRPLPQQVYEASTVLLDKVVEEKQFAQFDDETDSWAPDGVDLDSGVVATG